MPALLRHEDRKRAPVMSPSTPDQGRFVVLAAVDDSAAVHEVVRVGANFARMAPSGELHLVYVIEDMPPHVTVVPAPLGLGLTRGEIIAEGQQHMEEIASEVRGQYAGPLTTDVLAGDVCKEILELATRLRADLIVAGTHGRSGIRRMVLGSVAESLVRKASCPVLVVREKDYRASGPAKIEPRRAPANDTTKHA
jgi:nucleotide-binding universal stress UspA family protein